MSCSLFFFFNDPATTEIYTLSLHDALPICVGQLGVEVPAVVVLVPDHHLPGALGPGQPRGAGEDLGEHHPLDRKSTRLNSSHANISYAVFCLKKKKTMIPTSATSTSSFSTL